MSDMCTRHKLIAGDARDLSYIPDESVHLPGRNLLLLTKAAVYCQVRDIAAYVFALSHAGTP